jgi:hypothetical protein
MIGSQTGEGRQGFFRAQRTFDGARRRQALDGSETVLVQLVETTAQGDEPT